MISALEEARLFLGRRRQIIAQHVAAAEQIAAVDQQHAVAVVNARARLGRRNQPPQDRRDPFRIDREIEAVERVFARAVAFARMQIEQLVGIERDRGIGFDRRRRRDGAGDDLALDLKTLDARVDQSGAELRQKQDADGERHQAGDVENDDAAGETRGALGDEELQRLLHPAAEPREKPRRGRAPASSRPSPSVTMVLVDLRLGLSRRQRRFEALAALATGPFGFCGSIEHVSAGVSDMPFPLRDRKHGRHYYRTSAAQSVAMVLAG